MLFSTFHLGISQLPKLPSEEPGGVGYPMTPPASEDLEAGGWKDGMEKSEKRGAEGEGRHPGVLVPRLPVPTCLGKYSVTSFQVHSE